MGEGDATAVEPERPHLWNPDAAAKWCLLLTPAFGTAVHAANWRVLGRSDRARANLVWVGLVAAFLLVNLATLFLPHARTTDLVMWLVGVGLLFGWYINQGHAQVRYVRESLPDGYVRKRRGRPLLVAVAALAAYFAATFLVAVATDIPDEADLAAAVKPLIVEEWRREPALRGVSIQTVTLAHQGQRYNHTSATG